MSPFEPPTPIDVMWPQWARDPRIATVVTLHDLIPLVLPEKYLDEPPKRAMYMARLELVRRADAILAVSQQTAEDAVEQLHVPSERVHVINAGVSQHLAGMYSSGASAWAQLRRRHRRLRPGFILYVAGVLEFRKNVEGLIAGFGRLPAAVRAAHQLVIVCTLNSRESDLVRMQAEAAGIGPEELVLPGRVSDEDLGAFYRACTLFVFPSLYEGFGLPILEAMSCDAPVAASATPTAKEVLGDSDGTFDPHDPAAIASCLASVLSGPDTLERLRLRSRRRAAQFTWEHVAERSLEAYETALARPAWHPPRRLRIALVTPWPPDRSPIAMYSQRLAAALGRRVDVDVIVGRPVDRYAAPQAHGVRLIEARRFEQLTSLQSHDQVLYCMGGSKFLGHVYRLLKRRRGVVVLHDIALTDFYRWRAADEHPAETKRTLTHWIHEMYGTRVPTDATRGGLPSPEQEAALGIYMTREVQSYADHCFVHSRFAHDVLELDRGPDDTAVPISVLPHAMPPAAEIPRAGASPRPLIVSLGVPEGVAAVGTLIDAFALLSAAVPRARLVIGHEAGESAELERWRRSARDCAPGAAVEFSGQLTAQQSAELLRTADLAVQLQDVSRGNASEAIADCLASGVPTIVTNAGWVGELPPDVAEKVQPRVPTRTLEQRMIRLLTDRDKHAALSQSALAYARGRSFSRVADAYLQALDLV